MNIPKLSINRPIFITCIFILIIVLGAISLGRMAVDFFPDVSFPVVSVTTLYPGASPADVETQISKVLEDEMSSVSGLKGLSSVNKENVSVVIAEFNLDVDIKDAEQQVRNSIALIRNELPEDVEEPIIRRLDAANMPIAMASLSANLPAKDLYDLADQVIKPKLQQVDQVGLVEIQGGRKREIQVQLNLNKLRQYEISASQVVQQIALTGQNIPIGRVDNDKEESVFRLMGEFTSLDKINNTVVSFIANDVPVRVGDLASIHDTLEDETSRTFINGQPALILNVFKQSKSNTIAVMNGIKHKLATLNEELKKTDPSIKMELVWDGAENIQMNVDDVRMSILLGIALTIIVVLFFLGNVRSTVITGIAIPNSLLGAFVLMLAAGFSYNVMSLMALSLAVGLLIDDAIVVRENIFRHIENGASPFEAAENGTREVMLAVIATTCAVLAVFGPVGFLTGVIGQFFKEFGLTVCFAMVISLFDSLTMAPMLSAYFAGRHHNGNQRRGWGHGLAAPLRAFSRFQDRLETFYEKSLHVIIAHRRATILLGIVIFVLSTASILLVPKGFLPEHDFGEFGVNLELKPGTSLAETNRVASEVDQLIRTNAEVKSTVLTIGNAEGESHRASFYIKLVPKKERKLYTTEFKKNLREQLKPFVAIADPKVTDFDLIGANMRPFNLRLIGSNLEELESFSKQVFDRLKTHPALVDPEISNKLGKPEQQVIIAENNLKQFGLSSTLVGAEVRTLIQGDVPAVFREIGLEYDIRVRLNEAERNLEKSFNRIFVPNLNRTLVPLHQIASLEPRMGPSSINRYNRGRYINIAGDLSNKGGGLDGLMNDIKQMFTSDLKLPQGITHTYVGQAEDFTEMKTSLTFAMLLGTAFIYLVLASLYESFIIPLAIMLVLPLAICGAFLALFVTQQPLSLFSMIGCVLLLGVATKNSILLVDLTLQLMKKGLPRTEALVLAGKTRLRPILMTSFALIAGMLPLASGLTEVARMRQGMGIAVIGGVISSTFLSLIIVPAAFSYVDRLNLWVLGKFRKK